MRNEKEMFDLILGVAEKDERIRAVFMNGSRTNPNVPKDIFQDYDIVYVVTETKSFIKEEGWISVFGELLMLQEPDKNNQHVGIKMNFDETYGYLMLFTDGNRIDLRLQTKEVANQTIGEDPLVMALLDKDNLLPDLPPSTDTIYHVKKPTEALYLSSCSDFWWCLQNVAKGIWREELPYAKAMLGHRR
jgi:aminoglycoside 6-adenylyltransferase